MQVGGCGGASSRVQHSGLGWKRRPHPSIHLHGRRAGALLGGLASATGLSALGALLSGGDGHRGCLLFRLLLQPLPLLLALALALLLLCTWQEGQMRSGAGQSRQGKHTLVRNAHALAATGHVLPTNAHPHPAAL